MRLILLHYKAIVLGGGVEKPRRSIVFVVTVHCYYSLSFHIQHNHLPQSCMLCSLTLYSGCSLALCSRYYSLYVPP